jgi:hypothetical protein
MATLHRVNTGLYDYEHYSVEHDGDRWFVWDHNTQEWIADFATLREARAFLFEQG